MTAIAAPPPELQYAPRPPRRRRLKQRLLFLILLVGLVVASLSVFPTLRDRVVLFDLQRRCMSYSFPPSKVVHTAATASASTPPGPIPPEWAQLYASLSSPGFKSQGTVFLHAMRSKAGSRRLVGVDIVSGWGQSDIGWRLIEPGSVIRQPRLLQAGVHRMRWEGMLKVHGGIVDPNDPSHFTFMCTLDDAIYTVDGWLRNDDTVSIAPRKASP